MVLAAITSVICRCHFIVLVHQSDIGSKARIIIGSRMMLLTVLIIRLMALQNLVDRRQIACRLIHLHQIVFNHIFTNVLTGGAVGAFIICPT